jgi:hypothetical protein
VRCFLPMFVVLAATFVGAQERYLASPNKIGLVIGETQRLQVLNSAGKNVQSVTWTVEPEELGTISTDDRGFGVFHASTAGTATISGAVGNETVTVAATIYPGSEVPPGASRWVLPPLVPGAGVVEQLQSLKVRDDTPTFYVDEGSPQFQYVRAIDDDGIQQWVWPGTGGGEHVRLRCGDNFGGAVLTTERDGQFYVTVLRQDGTERWRVATAPWWTYTYTHDDTLYIIEDQPDLPSLSAFDGDTGQRKLQITFPTNLTQHLGYSPPMKSSAHCVPGESITRTTRSSHGSLVTDEEGVVHIAVTTLNSTFDATGCTPGQLVDASKAKLHVETLIQLLSITASGDSSWQTVRRLDQNVTGWQKPTEWVFPWGSTIPDGHGGVLIPVRGQIGSIVTGKTDAERGAIFRVHEGIVQEYQIPVLPPPNAQTPNMVLGENDIGFFGGDKSVVAYNVSDGHVLWVWKYEEPVEIEAALADGGVMVSAGLKSRKLIRLDAKGKIAGVTNTGDSVPVFR